MQPIQLLKEAVGIGASILIVFVIIHVILMALAPEIAMGHIGIFAGVFAAGALTHVIFEYTGGNDWFIKQRMEMQ